MKIDCTVALVTGGCGGLGRPVADLLLEKGARVIIADYNQDMLNALPQVFSKIRMDVTDPEDVRQSVKAATEEIGCIDILVNCAGRIVSAPLVNIMNPDAMMLSYNKFREDILINLDSVFLVTSAIVEQMVLRRKKGCIINISSISAKGNEGQTSYSAAKAAVEAISITWAKELGRFGIRCNAVAPGFIDTQSTHAALNDSQIKHIISNTPLRRLGNTAEISHAVISLIENDFINGAILAVDGGLTI